MIILKLFCESSLSFYSHIIESPSFSSSTRGFYTCDTIAESFRPNLWMVERRAKCCNKYELFCLCKLYPFLVYWNWLLALLLCTLVVVLFEWWGQVWPVNISGGPDAGLVCKCFLHINNAACIWRGRRTWQYSKSSVSGEQVQRRGGRVLVIKPRMDPPYPWEAWGLQEGWWVGWVLN